MVAYIACFLFTTVLTVVSENQHEHGHKKISVILGITAVIILSALSGIRSYRTGTDISFYILPGFYQARSNLGNFVAYVKSDIYQLELFFLTLEYIAAGVFRTPHFVLFILSLITNLFIYMGIINQRKYVNVPLAWMTFCLIYYNISLNLMRQSLSVAMVFFIFSYGDRLNWKKVMVLSAIAGIFHISGLISLYLYIVYFLIGKKNRLSGSRFWMFIIFLSLPVAIPYTIQIMNSIGLIRGKYLVFLGNHGEIAFGNIIFRSLGLLSFVLYCWRSRQKIINENVFLLYIGIINILLLFDNSLVFTRIGKYFEIFEISYFSRGMKVYSKKSGLRIAMTVLLILVMLFYWYYQFMVLGIGSTYPYAIDPDLFRKF